VLYILESCRRAATIPFSRYSRLSAWPKLGPLILGVYIPIYPPVATPLVLTLFTQNYKKSDQFMFDETIQLPKLARLFGTLQCIIQTDNKAYN